MTLNKGKAATAAAARHCRRALEERKKKGIIQSGKDRCSDAAVREETCMNASEQII
jgi:hypothetical protein